MGGETALVTGGGGFLGGAIVGLLVSRGDHVRSFSRTEHSRLKEIGVKQFLGDISDIDALAEAAKGCNIVFHVAAKAGIWGSYKEYHSANVRGTQNVISVCKQHNIKRLVYTGSPSVVFTGRDQEFVNESVPYAEKYLAYYPETKAIAERLVLDAASEYLATVSLRPHLIWGPGDNHLIPRLIARAETGRLCKIGRSRKLVDSVYIDNAAQAHLLAADRLAPGSVVSGKAYFISQGEPVAMNDLIDMILNAGGLSSVNRYMHPWAAYAAGWLLELIYRITGRKDEPVMTRFLACQLSTSHWFDIEAARRDFGYTPSVDMEEGLRRLSEYLRAVYC